MDVSDICSPILANIWNEKILLNKNFSRNLKLTEMSPLFKKKDETERIMQKQISDYIGKFLSPFLYGYRKGFSTQYILLTLIERWKFCLNKQGFAGAL